MRRAILSNLTDLNHVPVYYAAVSIRLGQRKRERERERREGEKGKKERGEKRGNVFVLFGSLSGLELARFETDFPLFGTAFNRIES